ncbi:MAG: hypothetical protein R3B09_28785 [Nannocystaceae bacterium]
MPINGGISDYASAGYMAETFDAARARRAGAAPMFLEHRLSSRGRGRWKKPLMDFATPGDAS